MKQHTHYSKPLISAIVLAIVACIPVLFNNHISSIQNACCAKLNKNISIGASKQITQPLQLFIK
jgi:hypothetical protein